MLPAVKLGRGKEVRAAPCAKTERRNFAVFDAGKQLQSRAGPGVGNFRSAECQHTPWGRSPACDRVLEAVPDEWVVGVRATFISSHRRHVAQAQDGISVALDRHVDLCLRRVSTDTEAYSGLAPAGRCWPSARSTCDGSPLTALQAEPLATQTGSIASSRLSPSTSPADDIQDSGIARPAGITHSEPGPARSAIPAPETGHAKRFNTRHDPGAYARPSRSPPQHRDRRSGDTGSVPGRSRRSWPPPNISGNTAHAGRSAI